MGDIIGSIFGGGNRQNQTTTPDPTAQALNQLRWQQLSSYFGGPYSNFNYFAQPNLNGAYTPSSAVGDLYNTASLSDTSNITNAVNNALAGQTQPANTDSLMSLADYQKLGLDASQNYIKQIATPQIMSQAALSGLESSGAPQEAIAKAAAEYALPFIQSLPGASQAFTANNIALANLPTQQANLRAQTANTLANTLNPYTSRDVGLASRAGGLFNFADYSRQLGEQDLLRQQGLATTALTGLPFTPGSSSSGRTSSQPLFNLFGQG